MARKRYASILSFLLTIGLSTPILAYTYQNGDRVRCIATTLKVRDSAAGNEIGSHTTGNIGTVRSNAIIAQYQGVTYAWYQIDWDSGTDGWSADKYGDNTQGFGFIGFTIDRVAQLAYGATFRSVNLIKAIAIARAESNWGPNAVGTVTPADTGLWQVNLDFHPNYTRQEMLDPTANAQAAYTISSQGTSWQPWATYYTTGHYNQINYKGDGDFKNYLDIARTAAGAIDASVIRGINDRVSATSGLKVRSSPGGTDTNHDRTSGNLGTITSSTYTRAQVLGSGEWYIWWQIQWDDGVSGWSAEEFVQRTGSGPTNYTIITSSSPSNGGTTSGGGTSAGGTSRTVTATANGGYSFVNWTENGSVVSSSASYTFTLNNNRSLVANFSTVNYTISTSSSPSNGGTTSGGGTFAGGTSRTVTATPNGGYTFVNWTENGSAVSASASYTFTLNNNRNLVANFSTVNYTITTSSSPSNGGTTSGGGTFAGGTSRTITATANGGYSFVNWTENGSAVSTSASYTFALNNNRNLVANFSTVNYTITTSSSPSNGGATSGSGTFAGGTSRTVTATANGGYTFVNWTENGGVVSTSSSYTFTLNSSRSLVANFTQSGNPPTVQTLGASSVTWTSAVINGQVVNDGGAPVDDYFFYFWQNPNSPIAIDSSSIAVSSNRFSAQIIGLAPGVRYFYRAYAHNSSTGNVGFGVGWGVGSDISFSFGSAKPDFNNDGNIDILWQNKSTGQRVIWLMNGITHVSDILLEPGPLDWKIGGTGDFDHDGNVDILWWNKSTGQRVIWLMNGTTHVSNFFLQPGPLDWDIGGTADFNHDGNVDILWQNRTTGQRVIWLMNGTTHASDIFLDPGPLDWDIGGTGDFDHDGNVDILWQNRTTGQRVIWLMNGTTHTSNFFLQPGPVDWGMGGTGDFNHDGSVDILWWNKSTGQRVIWLMDGTTHSSDFFLQPGSVDWEIRNH